MRSRSSTDAMMRSVSEVTARELFAPLGPTYDRYARLLSFGQDPRWRRFLVSRVPEGARVLDVATGTGAVALELQTRGCTVVGVDQSPEMLAVARRRGVEVVDVRARRMSLGGGIVLWGTT